MRFDDTKEEELGWQEIFTDYLFFMENISGTIFV